MTPQIVRELAHHPTGQTAKLICLILFDKGGVIWC